MKTKNKGFIYRRLKKEDTPPFSREVAFRNAFRHYKNYYLSTLVKLFYSNNPHRYTEFGYCPFNHPIEDEATGELAKKKRKPKRLKLWKKKPKQEVENILLASVG